MTTGRQDYGKAGHGAEIRSRKSFAHATESEIGGKKEMRIARRGGYPCRRRPLGITSS